MPDAGACVLTVGHAHVVHPRELVEAARRDLHPVVAWNDRLLDWLASHVLASMAMFDLALVLPLVVIPMPDSAKILLALFSGSWVQWWALPALQRSSNRAQRQAEAKADVDHVTLTYLAQIQDEQLEILKRLDGR